ncbi:porin family protein [Lewinella sp. LCG006]|uniref:porin family protein n=1 Tax=Lewinella sp. LCG006 TaxID=3231911 RepID=UPI00345FAEE7
MNKLPVLLITTIFLILTGSLFAQKTLSLGPRLGVNFSSLVGDDANTDTQTGLVLGLTSTYSINEKTGLGVDLLYSREGAESKIGEINTHLDYIRIPVTFQYFFRGWEDDFRPKIYAGIVPGILVGAEVGGEDAKDQTNGFDLAGTLGLGFNYRLSEGARGVWLNTDLRYQRGFTSVPEADDFEIFNQTLQFSVGVAFGLDSQ